MNEDEYAALSKILSASEKAPQTLLSIIGYHPRTLTYGPHLNAEGGKDTLHVYVRAHNIHRLIYSGSRNEIIEYDARAAWDTADLIPSKRSNPERCDFDFMLHAIHQSIDPNFTTWDSRPSGFGLYSGKIFEDFAN